jgi:N-formylglutamate deformylase
MRHGGEPVTPGAFSEVHPGDPRSHVIVHVPHASRRIPPRERARIVLDDAALERELDAITDARTDWRSLAAADAAAMRPWLFANGASRLLVDPERFPDDREEMLARGMGAVYTHTTTRKVLRQADAADDARLIDTYYRSYAAALEQLTTEHLAAVGRVCIVDVHSYPMKALPYELHQYESRPPLCIGVDDFQTPAELPRLLRKLWPEAVGVNEPFHGCYIPLSRYQQSRDVSGVMLEIRRDTFLTDGKPDEDRGRKIVAVMTSFLDALDRTEPPTRH